MGGGNTSRTGESSTEEDGEREREGETFNITGEAC